MKKSALILLLAMLFSCSGPAQPSQEIKTDVPFPAESIQKINNQIIKWIDSGYINGAVGLIIKDGEIKYYNAEGYNDLSIKTPLKKDDIFRIASQTKAITTVAVMMLYEEGKFSLDDPVSKFIPSFSNEQVIETFNEVDTTYTTVPAKRAVTIRDLLTHTSGIGYADIGTKIATAVYAKAGINAGLDNKTASLQQAMQSLGKLPLMFQPGEQWMYGLNTDLLGALVEIWSGQSLDQFFKTRIFQPIGMDDTYFNVPPDKASRLANLFIETKTGRLVKIDGVINGINADYPLDKKTYFSGGGGLSSTIMDYAKFLQMLLNEGEYNGKRILKKESVTMMTTNQIGDLQVVNNKFGFGFAIGQGVNNSDPSSKGTYGWGGAFGTSYWVDPNQKMIILFYRNIWNTSHNSLPDKFRIMAYRAMHQSE